ncbi:anti-sigma factor [Pedobacter sp. KBW06]|uniref:FecR family protein n=1 Tax=Pedobacter sp. KBW06 TaxID=2153359 RepID=UPI000F5AEEBD|nr:FecR family protein [Pedobacter sp. KBW06]RQO74789.1 anti-sigma factor [Pedobacter sp. KBW06]
MDNQQARDLWNKYLAGTCSAEETAQFESWYNQEFKALEEPPMPDYAQTRNEILTKIKTQKSALEKNKRRVLWQRIAVAASVLLVCSAGLFYHLKNRNSLKHEAAAYAQDVLPGNNKAILTLANGKKISLTDVSDGELAKQTGISIAKTADGQLVYKVLDPALSTAGISTYNTVETPRGGQHQIILQDGSKVWLNASSSIKFPVSFDEANQRMVVLSGQAYFEVARNKAKPFIVKTNRQTVEVLGTHFDVNAYADEASVKTTLLEGAVSVSPLAKEDKSAAHPASRILKPNQQSVLSGEELSVIPVETSDVVAWKEGKFMFNNEALESIMKKVSRWYNVEVRYANEDLKKNTYWGTISRTEKISKLLKMLETTGDIHFRIEGNVVTAMP